MRLPALGVMPGAFLAECHRCGGGSCYDLQVVFHSVLCARRLGQAGRGQVVGWGLGQALGQQGR